MRCATVLASTLAKEGTWLPTHYLGSTPEHDAAIARAKKRVREARRAVAAAERAKREANKTAARLLASGAVTNFTDAG